MIGSKWMTMFLMTLMVLMVPALVFAQSTGNCPPCPPVTVAVTPAIQEWWEVLLSHLVEIVGTLVLIIVPVLVRKALQKWGSKMSAEGQLAVQKLTDGILGGAVAFAEEQAKKALDAGEERTPGAAKLDSAVEYAMTQLRQSGAEDIARDELVRLLEAKLNMQRANMVAGEVAKQRLE